MEYTKFKVAGYLRLSQEDGDKTEEDKEVSNSIASQRTIIQNKLKELGEEFELVDFYIDDGYTGLNTDRPSFQRMLSDIDKGIVNTIITKDLSRLSRNSFEANYYLEIYFLERNVRYISILDNVDTYTKNSNNDIIQFKTLINDWYSKDISRKVRAGVWARKEKGLYLGARAPYGYDKAKDNKNKLVINVEQAEVIRLIFDMFDNGTSIKDIAKHLENKKVLCPDYFDFGGAKNGDYNWNSGCIRRFLRSQVYIGNIEYGKKINLSYKSKKVKTVPRESRKLVENTHEPIISKEQFERVQQKLDISKKVSPKEYFWELNGIVFCKECGNKMLLKVAKDKDGNAKYFHLMCSTRQRKGIKVDCDRKYKRIREKDVTEIVHQNINSKLSKIVNSEKLENVIEAKYNKQGVKMFDDNLEILQKQLTKTENTITALYQDLKNGILDSEDYKRFYQSEKERRLTIQKNMEDIIKQKENRPKISKEKLLKVSKELLDCKQWSAEQLSEIIYNIQIDKENKIYINYKYDIFTEV